jgi:hypothetical protein
MATDKIERAGVGFGVGKQSGSVVIEVRTHHDIIPSLRGFQVSFELLNGITAAQAKKVVDLLNENVIGVMVATASTAKPEEKNVAAAG